MKPEEITDTLNQLFNSSTLSVLPPSSWQVETSRFKLLVLLSEDESWLRILIPIVAAEDAQPLMEQLLAANFNFTQETRYALHQNALWGVFQHSLASLTVSDFSAAVARLITLQEAGLTQPFDQLLEERMRQIIQAAKRQGQSLEATLQNLDRFYQEGILGSLDQGEASREAVLAAWRRQLERLWPEVEAQR